MSESHGNATDPNEPKTPMWLTALGGALFLLAGLYWALPSSKSADDAPLTDSAAADAGAPQH